MTDLRLSHKEFWGLTWYEWGMEVWRHYKESRRDTFKLEYMADLTRNFMALYANAHRNEKEKLTPYEPEDFIRLSFDEERKKIESEPTITFKEAKALLGSKFKRE